MGGFIFQDSDLDSKDELGVYTDHEYDDQDDEETFEPKSPKRRPLTMDVAWRVCQWLMAQPAPLQGLVESIRVKAEKDLGVDVSHWNMREALRLTGVKRVLPRKSSRDRRSNVIQRLAWCLMEIAGVVENAVGAGAVPKNVLDEIRSIRNRSVTANPRIFLEYEGPDDDGEE